MSAPVQGDPWLGRTALGLGVVALLAILIPPGLLVAPILGVGAVALGAIAWARTDDARRATLAVTFGAFAVVASSALLFIFRHVIVRGFHDALR
jgi:hypothetical protein